MVPRGDTRSLRELRRDDEWAQDSLRPPVLRGPTVGVGDRFGGVLQELVMTSTRVVTVAVALVFSFSGCDKGKSQPGTPDPGQANVSPKGAAPGGAPGALPPGHPPATAPGGAPAGKSLGTGKVLETMTSGGYTYVKVNLDKGEVWAAGPETKIAVGDEVTIPSGMAMKNFRSKTLKRVFPEIYFVANFGKKGAPAGGPVSKDKVLVPAHGGGTAAAPVKLTGIKKLKGGYTVADVFGKSASLGGKTIKLRGKVTKFSAQIMGTNWLHVRDGTGKDGSNDLTVTTKATAKVGDTVIVTGKLTLNKDFGSGYKYAVIVEGAEITVE